MKTVVVWDQCGQDQVKYAVLDGDYTHLHGVFINDAEGDPEKEDELSAIFYTEDGEDNAELQDDFPIDVVKNEECAVITAGFYP